MKHFLKKALITAGSLVIILNFLTVLNARETYSVTITVLDIDEDPLPGLNINIWLLKNPSVILIDQDTDEAGRVACQLSPGSYGFDVYDYYGAYEYHEGTFAVADSAVDITVHLTAVEFEVLFEILDAQSLPIASAEIVISGINDPLVTDEYGLASIYLIKGYYTYTVSHPCYQAINSDVNIGGIKISQRSTAREPDYHLMHNMSASETEVIFNITADSQPVMGAKIYIEGFPDPLITNISGQASLYAECGSYLFEVTAGNYDPFSDSFTISGEPLLLNIALTYTPQQASSAISLENADYSGIWKWDYTESRGSVWTSLLDGQTAKKMMSGDIKNDGNKDLVIIDSDNALLYYDTASSSWNQLIPSAYQCLDFTIARSASNIQVIASLKDYGIYKWDSTQGSNFPSSWERIIMYPAEIIHSANIDRDPENIDELIVSFRDHPGMFIYSFSSATFSRAITESPSQITSADVTDDQYPELVLSFDSFGVYLAGYAPFDKRSYQQLEKSLEFLRITWGTPDTGHYTAAGDISSGFGCEIFMAYQGNTYLYSYDTGSWSIFLHAPLDRLISGRFTGHARDDLIISDSSTGSLYLYKTQDQSYELLLYNGSSNSMTNF